MEADILLLLPWVDKRHIGIYGTEIFEYLGARRPILAIGSRGGGLEEIVDETKAGVFVEKLSETVDILRDWITIHRMIGRIPYNGHQRIIEKKYSRKQQARQIAELLDKIVADRAMHPEVAKSEDTNQGC